MMQQPVEHFLIDRSVALGRGCKKAQWAGVCVSLLRIVPSRHTILGSLP